METARKWKREQCHIRLAKEERCAKEEIEGGRGYWAIRVMAIQSDGATAAIKQEERRYRMNLKLGCTESRHRTMLISMETQMRGGMERRLITRQNRQGGIELMHKQRTARSEIWYRAPVERMLQLQHRRRKVILEEEAGQHRKLEAGKRRMINRIDSRRQDMLREEELEDIKQYHVPLVTDPSTATESRNATPFASK